MNYKTYAVMLGFINAVKMFVRYTTFQLHCREARAVVCIGAARRTQFGTVEIEISESVDLNTTSGLTTALHGERVQVSRL